MNFVHCFAAYLNVIMLLCAAAGGTSKSSTVHLHNHGNAESSYCFAVSLKFTADDKQSYNASLLDLKMKAKRIV